MNFFQEFDIITCHKIAHLSNFYKAAIPTTSVSTTLTIIFTENEMTISQALSFSLAGNLVPPVDLVKTFLLQTS